MRECFGAKLREIHPLPLGEGRARVSGFAETCDPHPARFYLGLAYRARASRRPLPEGEATFYLSIRSSPSMDLAS
jgi:hypothetical protein